MGSEAPIQAAVHHEPASHRLSSVQYHVIYSTSYQVPVLYFFIYSIPPTWSRSIDAVYKHLVPKHLQYAAKEVGLMGGIGLIVSEV